MIDAAAIFPLDVASHCGYEEENRDKLNISHVFNSLFPLGKPLQIRHRGRESTKKNLSYKLMRFLADLTEKNP